MGERVSEKKKKKRMKKRAAGSGPGILNHGQRKGVNNTPDNIPSETDIFFFFF